jgi:hypothetical protein
VSLHWQGRLLKLGGYNHLYYILLGPTSSFAFYNYIMTNPQKGIWSFYNSRHDQSTMGIDPMNNISNNNKNTLCVTLFQYSPLTRRVFFNNIRREREDNIINIIKWVRGQYHQYHLGTLTSVSINHRKFSSSTTSSFSKECHHHLHQNVLV